MRTGTSMVRMKSCTTRTHILPAQRSKYLLLVQRLLLSHLLSKWKLAWVSYRLVQTKRNSYLHSSWFSFFQRYGPDQKFKTAEVKSVIEDVLHDRLDGQEYDPRIASTVSDRDTYLYLHVFFFVFPLPEMVLLLPSGTNFSSTPNPKPLDKQGNLFHGLGESEAAGIQAVQACSGGYFFRKEGTSCSCWEPLLVESENR